MRPPAATTRWHGITNGNGLSRIAEPAARAARGRPARPGGSPEVTVPAPRPSRGGAFGLAELAVGLVVAGQADLTHAVSRHDDRQLAERAGLPPHTHAR